MRKRKGENEGRSWKRKRRKKGKESNHLETSSI